MTDVTISAPASARRTGKRVAGLVHLWIGVLCGLPAAALGLTGSILVLMHPLPATVPAEPAAVVASIDAVMAAAQTANAGSTVLQYQAPTAATPAAVRLSVPRTEANPRGFKQVLIDPATLLPVPDTAGPPGALGRFVHDLHGNFLAGRDGRPVVGWVGAAMCFLAVTGLVLWWPMRGRWRAAFVVTGRGNLLMVLRELHGAAGIWGLIVFLIVSSTGVVISFPPTNAAGPAAERPAAERPAAERVNRAAAEGAAPPATAIDADRAAAAAAAAVPEMVLQTVATPRRPGEPYRVSFLQPGDARTAPMTAVTVDAQDGHVVAVRAPNDLALPERLRAWARPLHMGAGLGWVWWVLALVSGLLPVIFGFSGIAMWLIKRRNRARVVAGA